MSCRAAQSAEHWNEYFHGLDHKMNSIMCIRCQCQATQIWQNVLNLIESISRGNCSLWMKIPEIAYWQERETIFPRMDEYHHGNHRRKHFFSLSDRENHKKIAHYSNHDNPISSFWSSVFMDGKFLMGFTIFYWGQSLKGSTDSFHV